MTKQTTDREILVRDAYSDDRHLAARQALYTWQTPQYDLPGQVVSELGDVTGTIIDVGCGNGKYLRRLTAERPDLHLVGVDISAGILHGIPASVIVGDGHQLPVRDSTASAVLAMHMLYHLEDIDRGISELHRILRPDGIALVSTNSVTDKTELDDLWSQATGDLLGRPRGPRRISLSARFSLEDAPAVLSRHFHEVRVITYPGVVTVNTPQPIIAHLASYQTWVHQQGVPFDATIERVRQRLDDVIQRKGTFTITCLGGIMICRNNVEE